MVTQPILRRTGLAASPFCTRWCSNRKLLRPLHYGRDEQERREQDARRHHKDNHAHRHRELTETSHLRSPLSSSFGFPFANLLDFGFLFADPGFSVCLDCQCVHGVLVFFPQLAHDPREFL